MEQVHANKTLLITSCSKTKLDHPAPARDLYTGRLFQLVRQLAEENGWDWVIVSAKHGLVLHNQYIQPYQQRLQDLDEAEIASLSSDTIHDLQRTLYDEKGHRHGRIITILPKAYFKLIEAELTNWARVPNVTLEVITDPRGNGGLYQKVKQLLATERATHNVAHADPF